MLLSENNIKAELSYAYLHAVAARAGFSCVVSDRHVDAAGVDAIVRAKERFAPSSIYTFFSVDIQLKATSAEPNLDARGRYPFQLRLDHYNKLRTTEASTQQILAVLFLPKDPNNWLDHSSEGLITRRCAFWVSLRGAPESTNETHQTVYIPRTNVLSVEGLRALMHKHSLGEWIDHEL